LETHGVVYLSSYQSNVKQSVSYYKSTYFASQNRHFCCSKWDLLQSQSLAMIFRKDK